MKILGIETSCDETAISLVSGDSSSFDSGVSVENSVVLSQIQTHEKYGGVVPEVAARKHLEAIFPMLKGEVPSDGFGIDAIAVTAGPGLAPALRVGVEVAKTLAWMWHKPLVAVNHLEGHIYANWILDGENSKSKIVCPEFPALCLLVSGGHSELILMKAHGDFERIGETLDDAAGEAFDKVAKMLGLGYPGGPAISKLAENGNKEAFDFPRGLLDKPNFDFSFSGLKTSVLYTLRKLADAGKMDLSGVDAHADTNKVQADIAASFQEAVVDVLVRKTMRAAEKFKPTSIVLAGGVAANKELRERLISTAKKEFNLPVFVPQFKYSMDNAAMIAVAGFFRAQDEKNFADPLTLAVDPNLDIV
ncbi:MAG: tRNA (adenosine(37)-N6)-threonylcarbamoyltransferase complex transferase subunit TsaD [Candidatus Uhrbacteria bacterium]|nr:tRNA (adenosine(37)-N6)-threonylcarbamoyltransferase complex transferase subunit TsaD [Candidatus Uhrbacteria bacterium]